MKVTLWGTRGSLPSSGPETQVYGGNTPCVAVENGETFLILDAGSGIRRLGLTPTISRCARLDILLTHLHMDHIQGLGFFAPLYHPEMEVHIWGPASSTLSLPARLNRYLSPPLFPVHIRDLPCRLHFHEVPRGQFRIGAFLVNAQYVCHPGPTVGYRITENNRVLTYLPDHEPALGVRDFPLSGEWTSGWELARNADVLIHDAQYSTEEYTTRVGWGHSTYEQALQFAKLVKARRMILFHHDPDRTDAELEGLFHQFIPPDLNGLDVMLGRDGYSVEL